MKLSDIGEFGLIERIRRSFQTRSSKAPIGIGDDAAALLLSPSSLLLATTDMLIEGIHFDLSFTDFFSLGWKSGAVNLSDIAAMGGVPRFCLVALAIPPRVTVEHISEFYRGLTALSRAHGVHLVGGDTCSSRKGLVVSVTALGEARRGQVVTRGGARPGDLVFVTGTLGDSAAGLELLKAGARVRGPGSGKAKKNSALRTEPALESLNRGHSELIERHLRPVPRVAEGLKLARSGCATSMIDVSDGLSSDLSHICEESGAGAEIYAGAIPLSGALTAYAGKGGKSGVGYALAGGEDYEILFTAPPARLARLRALRIEVTQIGRITRERGIRLIDEQGRRSLLEPSGYDHFRQPRKKKGGRR